MSTVTSRFEGLAATHVLKADPDLGVGVPPAEMEVANQRAVAAVIHLGPPTWDPTRFQAPEMTQWFGLLLLDGLMLRCVSVGKGSACELFGRGDLIRPWDADGEYDPLSITLGWRIMEPTHLAVLDDRFAVRVSRWPSISAQLLSRVARRGRYLALSHAATHLRHIHDRLLLIFWLLAERWGRVTADGIRIDLPLTHDILAMLVGAQRPSVTGALGHLSQTGMIERIDRHQWLITRKAVDQLRELDNAAMFDTNT